MREGPLADLFRSTLDDPPADPPEAPRPGSSRTEGEARASGRAAEEASGDEGRARFGREDPAERRRAEEGADAPVAESPEPPAPTPSPDPIPPSDPEPPAPEPDPAPPQVSADDPLAPPQPQAGTSTVPGPRERLSRIFGDESQRHEFLETPRYGREEPAYEPRGGQPHSPVIRVVGVGGAGVNAVNRMVEAQIPGVEFMAVNTDLQSLQLCVADVSVHIGGDQTRGLGAGADPDLGFKSAFEEQDKIKRLLKGSDMVFIAAGAGGGTGTGAAPVIARLAREVGALTVGIITKPFSFEGTKRSNTAAQGIEALAAEVDTLIIVPNDRLLEVLDQQTSMVEAFQVADDVLRQGVQGISDLVTLPALINLDFADVRTTMRDAGQAILGIGMGTGDSRALFAAQRAIASPLLETSIDGARSILLSITGGRDLSLMEVSEAAKVIQEAAHPDANIIFGANVDEELTDQVWVTVVATRFGDRARPARRAAEPTIRRTKDAGASRLESPADVGGMD
ncbi:MAG TPA: cell division protein FtsZ, partial [Solirubrobacterales bacterium]|nr:cell division protein FtsZ [Solirubrobacterales bacterium]